VTVARVIAGMPQDLQGRALHHFRASELPFRTAEALRRWVRTEVVPFDAALFDRGEYLREAPDAVYVSDSGGKDPGARGRYFVDRELFLRLQSQAVDGLRRELRERFEWVEELEGWDLPDRLEEAPEGAGPGAVILFRKGLFDVVVFGGVARALGRGDGGSSLAPLDPPVTDDAAPAGQGSALGEPKPGQAPSPDDVPPHLALQEAIARDIGVALRLTVAGLLSGRCSPAPGLLSPTTPDGGLELAPTSRRQLQVLVGPLGLDRPEEVLALACGSDGPDEDAVYQVLQTLPWASVEGVLAALVAASMAASPAAGGGSSGLSPLLARLARELDLAVGAPASPTG